MLGTATLLFALAAIGGLYLAARHLRGNPPPIPFALVHGLIAAVGLILVLLTVLGAEGSTGRLPLALGFLVVAALGGFVLFTMHLRNRPLPAPLIGIHALVALVGFVLVLLSVLGAHAP